MVGINEFDSIDPKGGRKMKRSMMGILAMSFVVLLGLGSALAEEITIAYFPGWPNPFVVGWEKGWFEKEMGVKVNFRGFETGADICTAMASGHVVLGTSVGTNPFISAVSRGVPLSLISAAEDVGLTENVVAKKGSGIVTPRDLIGKKVGVPFSTSAHHRLLRILEVFGVKEDQVKILDMSPPDILAAFLRGDLDAGCAWDPARLKMLEAGGHKLVSEEDQRRWGIVTWGNHLVYNDFGKKNPQMVAKFLKVMNDSTKFYEQNPEETYKIAANKVGLKPEDSKAIMSGIVYAKIDQQLDKSALGRKGSPGDYVVNLKKVADFLVKQKAIEKSLDSFAPVVDTSYLETLFK
jgi:taurine transport system substrate-binding protein